VSRHAERLEARAEELRRLIEATEGRRAESWRRSMPGSATIAQHCTDSIERLRAELEIASEAAILLRRNPS